MNKKRIVLLATVPLACGIFSIASAYIVKPALLSHVPFIDRFIEADSDAEDRERQSLERNPAGVQIASDDKPEERPEALTQSSSEQPALIAAPDFVRPKSQMSQVVRAMREISALQTRMALGVAGSPKDLKASMLHAEEVFRSTANDVTSIDEVQSLARYVLSGGNPDVAVKALQNPLLTVQHRDLIQGVLSYATADIAKAKEKLLRLDARQFDILLDAHLTMVQVQLADGADTEANLKRLSYVANIVPGTLLEEAAIRRMVPFLGRAKDTKQFLYWVTRYQRRFSDSFYYEDFETNLIDSLVQAKAVSAQTNTDVLVGIFGNANARQVASLSNKMLLVAVQSGNSILCGQIQDSLLRSLKHEAQANTDTHVLIHICKAAEGDIGVLKGLQEIDKSKVSETVLQSLNHALIMAEAIQNDDQLELDEQTGPHLPLSHIDDYTALFASVAQQIDISVSAIMKADDNETRLNK